ncbi:MAG: SRPBCC family protein, partial [Marmoricola sp.]
MDIAQIRKQTSRQVRRQVRAARQVARLVADNPGMVKDLVVGLLPGAGSAVDGPSAALLDDDHEIAASIAAHDRVVSGAVHADAEPARVRRVVDDLSLLPQWLTLHAGWRGDPPSSAYVGAQFDQQIKIMGIPAQVSWTVAQADDDAVLIDGVGPMGLTLGLAFTVRPTGSGSTIRVDAGMSGDPIKGPLGTSVARSVGEAMDASLANLVTSLAGGVEGTEGGGTPVLHVPSGRRLDPRTPVVVGVGQVVQRDPAAPYREPAELAAQALRNAAADAGVLDLAARADAVFGVATASWLYRDSAALVADLVGATPDQTVQTARFGGDGGQLAINTAGQAVADGDASVVLVFGAEAGATLAAAQKDGATPAWTEQDPSLRPTRTLGSDKEANTELEGQVGLGAPVYNYALMESALRARAGETVAEHTATITRLWSSLSRIAAANEYAWQPQEYTPEELAAVTPDNRMVSTPYPKLLCANLQVDLASGIIVTSVAAATELGIDQDRWVFLHAGAAAYDDWFVSERGELDASPAIRTIGEAALAHAGLGIGDVEHVDLYACFPAAVQIAARELGLPLDDPARPLSVTGGLTFAGGPGNNFGGHAVATLVRRLRADPTAYGLSTSLGWYVTKHALGIYS